MKLFFLNLVQETSIVLRGWRFYAKSTVHILLHLYTCNIYKMHAHVEDEACIGTGWH